MKNVHIKRGISLLLVILLAIGLLPISHLMAEPVDKGSLSDCCDSIGVLFFDGNDRAVEAGTDGFFEVQENDPYQLVFQFRSSAGFEPGRYTYDIPADGITISDSISEGQVIVDRVVIGEWTLTGNCLTVTFNGLSAGYSNVDVAIKIACSFEGLGERTILDGAAQVRVVPVVLTEPGIKKGGSADDDLLMLHWSVLIQGGDGFPVVGQTLTDRLGSNQKYIDSEVTLVANTGEESYRFTVPVTCSPAGDAADATSWSYTFPSKLTDEEGVERTLSDEWSYLFEYSTERTDSNTVGTVIYYNEATVNDVTYEGQIKVKLSDLDIDLTKTVADAAEDGSIAKNWTVSFTIPASSDLAQYPVWRIQDTMQVRDEDNTLLAQASALGGLDNATVTIAYGGREYTAQKYVPGTTPTADFLFRVSSNNKQLYLIKKCTCEGTEHCGSVAHGECATSWVEPLDGYCACWNLDSDAVVTVQYTTTDESMKTLIDQYPSKELLNQVQVLRGIHDADGRLDLSEVGYAEARTPIPTLFVKDYAGEDALPTAENGYRVRYSIKLNEAKMALTADGGPVTVQDQMSNTLRYVDGSLTIETEDKEGQTAALTADEYTAAYDKATHQLTVTLLQPETVMYTLTYDALIMNPRTGLQYSNSAQVDIQGETYRSAAEAKALTDVTSSGERFFVTVHKTESGTTDPVAGAVYGLYKADGTQITSGTTGDDGSLMFYTIAQQVVLQAHVPYYIVEMRAPEGFKVNPEKTYFYFCDEETPCETCGAMDDAYLRVVNDDELMVEDEREEPEVSDPETSEPESTESEASDPETTESETSEPESTESETSEPESTESETSEPESTESEASEPEISDPEISEPEASEPEASEPETSEPETSEPESTESEASEPESTESEASEPESTESEASEPEASEPEASEPESSEPGAPISDEPTYTDPSQVQDETENVESSDTTPAAAPQTGDQATGVYWMALALLSLLAMAGAVCVKNVDRSRNRT